MVINLTNQEQVYAHTVYYIRDVFWDSIVYFELQYFFLQMDSTTYWEGFFKIWEQTLVQPSNLKELRDVISATEIISTTSQMYPMGIDTRGLRRTY